MEFQEVTEIKPSYYFSWPRIGSANDGNTFHVYANKKGKIFMEIYPRQIFFAESSFSEDVAVKGLKESFTESKVIIPLPGRFNIDNLLSKMNIPNQDVIATSKLIDVSITRMNDVSPVNVDREVTKEDGEGVLESIEFIPYKIEKIKFEIMPTNSERTSLEDFLGDTQHITEYHPLYFSSTSMYADNSEEVNKTLSSVLFIIPTLKEEDSE